LHLADARLLRWRLDRFIDELIRGLPERDYVPAEYEGLLFSFLTQLPEWPNDHQIHVLDADLKITATYRPAPSRGGVDPFWHNVELVLGEDGYLPMGEPSAWAADDCAGLQQVLQQLGSLSELGMGGNFPASSSLEGRCVTVREQMVVLVKRHRAQVFAACRVMDGLSSRDLAEPGVEGFLPFWSICRAPLPAAEQVEDPDLARDEQLDALFHTRCFTSESDTLARASLARLLLSRCARTLIFVDTPDVPQQTAGPATSALILRSLGDGDYAAYQPDSQDWQYVFAGSDSLYLAVGSLLQPHEYRALGMATDHDKEGLRRTVGEDQLHALGPEWDPRQPASLNVAPVREGLPPWLQNASRADCREWRLAVNDYQQALVLAQAPGLPALSDYAEPSALQAYVNAQLSARLRIDHGLERDPDEIFVTITYATPANGLDPVPNLEFPVNEKPDVDELVEWRSERESLSALCLRNISRLDLDYWTTAFFSDADDNRLPQLDRAYVYALVRELNAGQRYSEFLRSHLLDSDSGQWSRERYVQVMQAQMRLDALEAKLAGDFLDSASLPSPQRDRGYKWVSAALDAPLDDGSRPEVEHHRVKVRQLRVSGLRLHGVLVFAPESSLSVAGLVLFTPGAPQGVRLREYRDSRELHQRLVDPALLDYWCGCVDDNQRADLRRLLTVEVSRVYVEMPDIDLDFYQEHYDTAVSRLLQTVDDTSTTAVEADLNSLWNILTGTLEFALEFAPFVIRLPIAAARSAYWLRRGLETRGQGDGAASAHLLQAALLLVDCLSPGSGNRLRRVPARRLAPTLNPRLKLASMPGDAVMRTDGLYANVYEKRFETGQVQFFAQDGVHAYALRLDTDYQTWRVIDPRRPDAFYQAPVELKPGGGWGYRRLGLLGGVPRIDPELVQISASIAPLKAFSSEQLGGYLAYLQQQRPLAEVRRLLRVLGANGVDRLPPTYAKLHASAVQRAAGRASEASTPVLSPPVKRSAAAPEPPSPTKKSHSLPVEKVEVPKSRWPRFMYHYTTRKHYAEALGETDVLGSSKDAYGVETRFHQGVYLTDLAPDAMPAKQLAEALFGRNPYDATSRATKVEAYMEFDMGKLRDPQVRLFKVEGERLSPHIYLLKSGRVDESWQVTRTLGGRGEDIRVAGGVTEQWAGPREGA